MEMRKLSSSLIVLSVVFFSMGTVQPGYGMSFGKHHNGGGGPANQSSTQGMVTGMATKMDTWPMVHHWTVNLIRFQFPNRRL